MCEQCEQQKNVHQQLTLLFVEEEGGQTTNNTQISSHSQLGRYFYSTLLLIAQFRGQTLNSFEGEKFENKLHIFMIHTYTLK